MREGLGTAGLGIVAAALAIGFFGAKARLGPSGEDRPAVEVHYSPGEDLERIDVKLIGTAKDRLDIAAYVLTDQAVTDAVRGAAGRGVAVRLLRDYSESGIAPIAPAPDLSIRLSRRNWLGYGRNKP